MAGRNDRERDEIARQLQLWEEPELKEFTTRQPERQDQFETYGGLPVERLYTVLDEVQQEDIGLPGQYPFTRGN